MTKTSNSTTASGKTGGSRNRVFLVDDHAMFREGLRQLIERDPQISICGEAADADTALEGLRATQPDLAIVDITLGGTSGIDLIKSIKAEFEDLPVLVVSMHDEALYAERALRAGAMGYVMKDEPSRTVKAAIQKVLAGDMHLSDKMASSMLGKMMRGEGEKPESPLEALSNRELEVFRMLGEGKSVRTIAEEMNVTIPTINSFRNRIKEKLHLDTSTEVMLRAIQWVQDEK